MKVLFLLLILCGCTNKSPPSPTDTTLKQEKDWEFLYARELSNALLHEDDLAYYFFWPLYLKARYENKLKVSKEAVSE